MLTSILRQFRTHILISGLYLLIGAELCPATAETIPIKNFKPRQERIHHNGVLVSRPSPLDETILLITRQNQINTIEGYATWINKNITYTTHQPNADWTQDLERFLRNRRGDCKDFAALNSQALTFFGYQPHVLALTSRKGGHAICAFQYNGKLYWFDNAQLKPSRAQNLTALAKELTEELNYSKSFEIDLSTQKSNLLYSKS